MKKQNLGAMLGMRKSILIVDDNKMNLMLAQSVMKREYEVTTALGGADALALLDENLYDCILLDINMPQMDGFEVISKIKADERLCDIPVVFLTADSDPETETRCFKEGALDFIAKPFVPEVMLSRIGRILEIEDLRKSLADRLLKKTQEVTDIKNKTNIDPLTGLYNRAYTQELVEALIEKGVTGAMMMIDMDNFKLINDNYGHIAGDEVLKKFAQTMKRHTTEGDVLCRIGGDEFVAFIEGPYTKDEIASKAQTIIDELCEYIGYMKFETNSSVSIGISQTPENGTDFTKLYNCADKALYYVKQNGKNSYHFFSDQRDAESKRGSKAIDLDYLKQSMKRSEGNSKGAYLMDFESFHHIYNFIKRSVKRSNRQVQTVLFTAHTDSKDAALVETALEALEEAVFTSLRNADVSTRYSSKQIIVILMDTTTENAQLVAERILGIYNDMQGNQGVKFTFDCAQLDCEDIEN